VDDRQRGDGARGRGLVPDRGPDGLQLAAGGAVDDLPATCAKAVPYAVRLGELALASEPDPLFEEPLGFGSIRSSWL
jgi:hypothetical protein